MARKKGKGPGQVPQLQRPQAGAGAGSWGPLRDSIRRDVEQAIAALAFAERLHQKMDIQRRAFLDFPRIMEQLRSGAMERLTASLSRLYEGGQGFDLARFLRDLPLALAQLAAADKSRSIPPPAPPSGGDGASAPPSPHEQEPALAAAPAQAAAPVSESASPVSPRVELRARMLAAAPNLTRAAQSFRRNVATLRRASQPRRSPGPWRADREVLEEARRAVEFVQKMYDTYAEAWADEPLTPDLSSETSAELDRFLAWTQLDRYVELAVLASTNAPRPAKPGQHVISAPKEAAAPPPPVTEASIGAVVAHADVGPAADSAGPAEPGAAAEAAEETQTAAPGEPIAESEPGRA